MYMYVHNNVVEPFQSGLHEMRSYLVNRMPFAPPSAVCICYAQSSDSDHPRFFLREPRIQALRSQSEDCRHVSVHALRLRKPPTNEIKRKGTYQS